MKLINRDLLLAEIAESREKNPHKDSKIRANHTIEHDHIAHLVLEQPTAYNVDKVVERIKKEIGDCMCEECDRHTDCDTCRAEKAVEIIKSGGIE